jgi:hypothetical protein
MIWVWWAEFLGLVFLTPVVGFENLGREKPILTLENRGGLVIVRMSPPAEMEKNQWRAWDVWMVCDFSGSVGE